VRKLLRGIDEFRRTRREAYAETFARLALGQKPDALAIACSDSRVSPVEFASSEPGDVFVVRNVGNLVPPYEEDAPRAYSAGAAIEYALAVLPIEDVVVCGHSECGAMRAIHEGTVLPGAPHLNAWLDHGRRSLQGVPPPPPGLAVHNHLSQQSVLRQIENLRTYPAVRDGEREGRIRLSAWWFDIARAEVLDYEGATQRFVPLDEARIARLLAERETSHDGTPRD
jgi:carbonic anhydrase